VRVTYLEDLYFFAFFKRVNDKNVYRVKNITEFKRRDKGTEKF